MTKIDELPEDTVALRAALAGLEDQLFDRDAVIANQSEQIAAHMAMLSERDERIARLEHQIEILRKQAFGPRSEKRPHIEPDEHARQGALLFPELLVSAQRLADETGAVGKIETEPPRKKQARKGRRAEFPGHLPRYRTTIELPEEQRQCCGVLMEEMGEEVSKRLERIEICAVHEIARKKYICRQCQEGVRTAPTPPQVIDKGLLGTSFLSQVLVERFLHHMPYHRLEKKYASEGLALSRTVLCETAKRSAVLLEPVWEQMKEEVLATGHLFTDDTSVTIQDAGAGRKTGRLWIYADRHGRLFYDFSDSRGRDGPARILGDFRGHVQADAYPAYDVFFGPERATEVACWAHTRRYFERAEETEPELAREALDRIGELYAVERAAKEQGLDAEATRRLREEEAMPRLEALDLWLARVRPTVLDKSPMAKAIDYARSNWEALVCYTTDGDLEIDNNRAERALRAVVTGRKNWMFVGNEGGGRTAAILYSVVQSCKEIEVDPRQYLSDVLIRLRRGGDPCELTPHAWKERYAEELVQDRAWVLAKLHDKLDDAAE